MKTISKIAFEKIFHKRIYKNLKAVIQILSNFCFIQLVKRVNFIEKL